MEESQKEHIKKNLVELIKLTTCNTLLITRLIVTNVLGQDDVEELELPNLTPLKKSKKLFEILVTRVGAYDHLIKSLEDTQQSGALEILKAHSALFRNFGSITYDENHVLGTGSSGTKVFKGVFGGREVAVKVLHTYLISSAVAVGEVNMLKNLDSHQNIIRYFTAESQANFICIALELCVISLQDEVKLNLVNIEKTDILRQCALGLAHLHKNKVIHGDLKPANILLSRHQQVKLSDFGIAKQIQTGRTSVSTANVGTLDYLALEILKPVLEAEGISVKVKMSNAADVFSLGCVFHFALTDGVHPFGMSPFQRQNNILQCQPNVSGDIEDLWKNMIFKMISSTINDRPSVAMILSKFEPSIDSKSDSAAIDKPSNLQRTLESFESAHLFEPNMTSPQTNNLVPTSSLLDFTKSESSKSDKVIVSEQELSILNKHDIDENDLASKKARMLARKPGMQNSKLSLILLVVTVLLVSALLWLLIGSEPERYCDGNGSCTYKIS